MSVGTGRVIVGLVPSLAGYQALRYAVAEARRRGVPLIGVRVCRISNPGLGAPWMEAVQASCRAEAAQVFAAALGRPPSDIPVRIQVVEGVAGRALPEFAESPDDLIVIGAARRSWSGGRTARTCTRRAMCPVVIVPAPEMARMASTHRLARRTAADAEKFLTASG